MKIILLITFFFSIQIFANYSFSDEKTVKIDMHGGKSESLTNTNEFSSINFKKTQTLRDMTVQKPTKPIIPVVNDIKVKDENE